MMNNDLAKLVVEALNDEDEIRLHLGNDEFYVERPDFSITIGYSLDCNTEFYSLFDDCSFAERYVFSINNILFYDLNTDTEHSVILNNEIREVVVQNAVIDNWSGSLICLANALCEY